MINPIIFYWIELIDSALSLAIFVSGASICAILAVLIYYFINEWGIDCNIEGTKKAFKTVSVILVVSTTLAVVLPTKPTMYKMLIASYATEDNYNSTKEEMTELIDYIADKFNGVGDE